MSDYHPLVATREQEAAWKAAGLTNDQQRWIPPTKTDVPYAARKGRAFEPEDVTQRVTALTSEKADRMFGRLKSEREAKQVVAVKKQRIGISSTLRRKPNH